jgi:small subunit ribosomal protein S4e
MRQSPRRLHKGDVDMGKRGAPKHMKRIVVPTTVPIHDKKDSEWMIKAHPGPHPREMAIPLGVLLRDVLKVARTGREVHHMLSGRLVRVDGKIRVDEKFPVGLMDVVTLADKNYRILLDSKGRLTPTEIKDADSSSKTVRVVKKHTIAKGKTNVTFHDGRNLITDNHVSVGDSVVISLPKVEFKNHLKRDKGSKCLVVEGKHAGSIVSLKEIIQRKGGKPSEAVVTHGDQEFITVANYLFVVEG